MTTTTGQAKQVVADLRDKLAALEDRKLDLEAERDMIAFDAHTGNDKARAKLTKINGELVAINTEIAGVHAAIREGEARVLQAQGIAREEIARQNAEAALKRGRAAMDAMRVADQSLRSAFGALTNAADAVNELHRLGCPPSPALFAVNVKRAIIAAAQGSRFPIGDHMSPAARTSLTELADGWSKSIENWASQRLAAKQAKAA